MGQTENMEKAPKTSWFTGLKAEFARIIWPERSSIARQTVAVVAVTAVLGLIIALLDWIIQYGVNYLIGL
ncbi:MAG: preprotein translocase subunit SecE [Agathobacter sp.]|nr:preprotein translocase subunit SecE [Agathobacter sp.]